MKWIRIKFAILSLGLRIDAVQVFSCFNVLEIPFCVKWKTTWMFPEEGFFRENLSITCLWLNFCQYSPFQSSLRKPEGSNISPVGREGRITRRDHSCCVVRTSFGCVQTGAFRPAPPVSRIPCAHRTSGRWHHLLVSLALGTVFCFGNSCASDRRHLPIHFEFPLHWHWEFKTIQSTVNGVFFKKKKN